MGVGSSLKRFRPLLEPLTKLLATLYVLRALRQFFRRSMRERLGSIFLSLGPVKKEYKKQVTKEVEDIRSGVMTQWAERYGEAVTKLPENGWSINGIFALIQKMSIATNAPLVGQTYSGSIYSNSYSTSKYNVTTIEGDPNQMVPSDRALVTTQDFEHVSVELNQIYSHAFSQSYLWNSLHGDEFGIGYFIEYQVVRMVADMFGGKKDNVMGFVTSGGTESLMVAMRSYREWGLRHKGLAIGDGVIIVGKTVHAAVDKAAVAYHLTVVHARCDNAGNIDLAHMRSLLKQYRKRVICVVGSAPSYPTGVVDDIKAIAKLAKEFKVGMHVDCCLGGFIINHMDIDTDFLALDGVTSLSADTHKNGWAPKGSSVLVCRPIPFKLMGPTNLAFFSTYSIPSWSGGPYGTPRDPGSQSVTPAFTALLALLYIGKKGYRDIALAINSSCQEIAAIINASSFLKLTATPEVNVVTWEADPSCGWGPGSIYAYASAMAKRGVTLSAIQGNKVHFCVTGRFAANPDLVSKFAAANVEAEAEINALLPQVLAGECSWPGDAGLYGKLDAAMDPKPSNVGFGKFIENWLVGKPGAQDAVRGYFVAHLDPYHKGWA